MMQALGFPQQVPHITYIFSLADYESAPGLPRALKPAIFQCLRWKLPLQSAQMQVFHKGDLPGLS